MENEKRKDTRSFWKNAWRHIKKQADTVSEYVKMRIEWHRGAFHMYDSSGNRKKRHTVCVIDSLHIRTGKDKTYLIYADGTKDDAGNIVLFAAAFNPDISGRLRLAPIDDPEEKDDIESFIADIRENSQDQLNALPF